jgi:CheY-like chemotaxis protein
MEDQPIVLIVEDELIVAMDLQSMLGKTGYRNTIRTNSGEKAIAYVERERIDLVLMDVSLKGGIDGFQAAEKIRSIKDIPIIFITANIDLPARIGKNAAGPFRFVRKPFDEDMLKMAIEGVLPPRTRGGESS